MTELLFTRIEEQAGGNFALALSGSLRRVHEPTLNSFASKRIVPIIAILPNLHPVTKHLPLMLAV
ncbi:MAG: hypothetical protein A3I39_02080 [Candidatus Yanofskybacteria bacterium RIFCSPLOWO2_02_FULL_47_9b]|uniref:Uncharacterized protein n=1 Tax=Candidatus Yanofskybacteria bacterium RIFCSPLOWO2_02_FULL_47_9b TaxID=1802708 RepID=A0A1F8HBR4_9BACT|nr:MAG: hypothetical protein A3I39_02080 [Candidatus Yanofskybacteria bacterium RIFCSPLOWO2_02_FULL_47_9b]